MSTPTMQRADTGRLRVERDGAVAWVLLDRTAKRNALSPAMWAALPGLLAQLDADPQVRVIGLRGAGGTFSAGADIAEIHECLTDPRTGLPSGGLLSAAESALAEVRKPTIAALEGFCMGGAWMLAGACDLRIAARSLRIGLTPARIGIVFPESGIEALVRLVGPGIASYLLLTGDTVTSADAERWGMLTRVLDDTEFDTALATLAQGISGHSQISVQAQKYLIRHAGNQTATTRRVSDALYREVTDGGDAEIGRRSFLAKKTPAFRWSGEGFWQSTGR